MSAEIQEEKTQITDLEKLVRTLRDTIMELRGLLDELSNPVVPYQLPVRERGETAAAPKPEKAEEKPSEKPKEERKEKPAATVRPPEARPAVPPTLPALQPQVPVPTLAGERLFEKERKEVDLERLASLLRILYELESKAPPEYLEGMVEVLYNTGLINEVQKKTVSKLLELVQIGVSHGLGVQESIAMLAALARELGLDVSEITAELVRAILRNAGAHQQWESQR